MTTLQILGLSLINLLLLRLIITIIVAQKLKLHYN